MAAVPKNIRDKASRAVREAIKKGLLRRAQFCTNCGAKGSTLSNGLPTIQGHHIAGYEHPLIVEWLCVQCHRDVTPISEDAGTPVYGPANGSAKLSREQVQQIRTTSIPGGELARMFGVNRSSVNKIRRGEIRRFG